nr:ribonuclease domain-containing protein [Mycobacterium sp. 155]
MVMMVGLLAGCGHSASTAVKSATVTSATAVKAADGMCDLGGLPPQTVQTVKLIESGGPFPYPRNDGIVFGNYERALPQRERGYYHEYTVPTPGAKTRGTRRIVTGGQPLDHPPEFYYTGDHYQSFCRIGGM